MSGLDPLDPAWRLRTDREADKALSDGVGTVTATALDQLIDDLRSLQPVTPWVVEWIEQVVDPPWWARQELIDAGQAFFIDWDIDIAVALFCASLPFTYGDVGAVEVLATGSQLALPDHVARRVAQTGRWLVAACQPGGLGPGAHGYRMTRVVRLLHAAVRARTSPSWDVGAFGCPVNQDDQLQTLLSFTIVTFAAMERLGLPVSEEDRAAYLHLWAVIGEFLGVDGAETIRVPSEAEWMTRVFEGRHRCSPAGKYLAAVLLREMEVAMPWGLRKLPRAVMRRFLGDEQAKLLDIPYAPGWARGLSALARSGGLLGRTDAGRRFLMAPSRLLGRSLIRMWIDRTISEDGNEPIVAFDGDRLCRWKIKTDPSRATLTKRGRMRRQRCRIRQRQLGFVCPEPVVS